VSKLGIDDGSCFLCGGTVLVGFSTAASAILGTIQLGSGLGIKVTGGERGEFDVGASFCKIVCGYVV
jgi:hypothetical protein